MIDYQISPLQNVGNSSFKYNGCLNEYIKAVTTNWLLTVPESNPGILDMFRDRDRLPYRDLVPWAGEFAGKYLTGALQILRVNDDKTLEESILSFATELVSLQSDDGYLGPWPKDYSLKNHVDYPDGTHKNTWDTWGHYHVMLGLLLYFDQSGDDKALQCACKIGDLICRKYGSDISPKLVETGSTEMNLAPAHSLCLLYRYTGKQEYLDMAKQIVDEEFGMKDKDNNFISGNWLQGSLSGQDFYQLPRPRWEALHPIMAIVELYWLTGEEDYRKAFVKIWESIVRLDRHNNGGFSSGEQAQGNPYHQGAIETCCTIAWSALTVEMLKMTGDSRVADELEMTLYNSIIGMHSVSGRWATYNTPMDGVKKASAHEIVFQSREGTPELNCCSVNSARGFGLISDWAVMQYEKGIKLNLYEPGEVSTTLRSGNIVNFNIDTKYPRDNRVVIKIDVKNIEAFTIALRIPRWSVVTSVSVNGDIIQDIKSGEYLLLNRKWQSGDFIDIIFDFSLHCWIGEKECNGKISLYRGPILLTYDRRFNSIDPIDIPPVNIEKITGDLVEWHGRIPPIILLECPLVNGDKIYLCDFGSAGEGGSPYLSWLPINNTDIITPQFFSEW